MHLDEIIQGARARTALSQNGSTPGPAGGSRRRTSRGLLWYATVASAMKLEGQHSTARRQREAIVGESEAAHH